VNMPGSSTPLVEGFAGLPVRTHETQGPAPGSTEWLLIAIERHASAEADALAMYQEIGVSSGDPVVAFVMRLILDDEERHHGLLKRIEASLRDALEWSHSPTALPSSTTPQHPLAVDLADKARTLMSEERTGAVKLRELAATERDISDGLHSLLLEMMAVDSEKHARLLEYVFRRLQARSHAGDGPRD
jgi:hypothetical protein